VDREEIHQMRCDEEAPAPIIVEVDAAEAVA
jgi:hypothetical protein